MSKIRLQTQQLKLLGDKFLECPCCKDTGSRRILFDSLSNKYPAIIIDPDSQNLSSMFYGLIRKCLEYEGALKCFIDDMNELYERDSLSIRELIYTYEGIFSFPPSDALIKVEDDNLVILINNRPPYPIPYEFDKIDENQIRDIIEAEEQLRVCKGIHTLCERLVRNYIGVYQYIISEQFDTARKNIQDFYNQCVVFTQDLQELQEIDNTIFLFAPFDTLKIIPDCIISLQDTMNFPPQNSYCQLGKDLANRINDLLFEALRLADRILQNHLNSNNYH